MVRCALCEAEFDTENESAEHLIPNAIGGRRKVMGFICRECNSSAGETWDAEVARQLLWLSLMVGVSRERGQLPSLKVITTADERLTIRSDGSLALSDPSFKEAQLAEGRTSYRIQARSMNEAQRMMEGLKRKHPEIDVDSLLAQAEVAETYPRGAIRHDFEFGGELGGRSIVKSCMALAFDSGIDWAVCEPGLNYLRKNNAPACFGYYQERDLVAQRVEGVPLHCVAVRANPESGLVLAYAEYFGIHRIVACLGENYEGAPVVAVYAIDPRDGKGLNVHVDLAFQRSDIDDIYAYKRVSSDAMKHAVSAIIGPILQCRHAEERDQVLKLAVKKAFESCGAKPGEMLAEEHIKRISQSVAESMASFILHGIRPIKNVLKQQSTPE